jgi:hypothetical protein
MRDRPGCLTGLLELAFLNWIFDWLQEKDSGKSAGSHNSRCWLSPADNIRCRPSFSE